MGKKRPRRLTGLQHTAYHEAGHAVAAIEQGKAFKYVTIVPDEAGQSLGHVLQNATPRWFRPDLDKSDRVKHLMEREVIVLVAGAAAAGIASGQEHAKAAWRGAGGDLRHAVDLASYFYEEPKLCGGYVDFAYLCALVMLKSRRVWGCVEALAAAMLQEKRLSYRKARSLWEAANEVDFQRQRRRTRRQLGL